jgi:hypothetical protein
VTFLKNSASISFNFAKHDTPKACAMSILDFYAVIVIKMVERKGAAKTIEVYPIEDVNINLYICNGN